MFGAMKHRETAVCVRQATLLVACKEHVGEVLSLYPHPWLILRQIHYDRLKEWYQVEEPLPPGESPWPTSPAEPTVVKFRPL